MSDLGAIFHVKKDGVQYDAHAYTTLDECPEPNLKLMYKGQHAYVKLEAKGSGDIPCYVKPKSGSTVYQVKKEASIAPPSGSTTINSSDSFTVPPRVTVLYIIGEFTPVYVGVTPNTTHKIKVQLNEIRENIFRITVGCSSHKTVYATDMNQIDDGDDPSYMESIKILWSPEINKHATDVNDYN